MAMSSVPSSGNTSSGEDNQNGVVCRNSLLSRQLLSALQNYQTRGTLCDVKLQVGEEVLRGHSCVLAACSPLLAETITDEAKHVVFRLNDITARSLGEILQYMYTGMIGVCADNVHELLDAASFLGVTFVTKKCKEYLKYVYDQDDDDENLTDTWESGSDRPCVVSNQVKTIIKDSDSNEKMPSEGNQDRLVKSTQLVTMVTAAKPQYLSSVCDKSTTQNITDSAANTCEDVKVLNIATCTSLSESPIGCDNLACFYGDKTKQPFLNSNLQKMVLSEAGSIHEEALKQKTSSHAEKKPVLDLVDTVNIDTHDTEPNNSARVLGSKVIKKIKRYPAQDVKMSFRLTDDLIDKDGALVSDTGTALTDQYLCIEQNKEIDFQKDTTCEKEHEISEERPRSSSSTVTIMTMVTKQLDKSESESAATSYEDDHQSETSGETDLEPASHTLLAEPLISLDISHVAEETTVPLEASKVMHIDHIVKDSLEATNERRIDSEVCNLLISSPQDQEKSSDSLNREAEKSNEFLGMKPTLIGDTRKTRQKSTFLCKYCKLKLENEDALKDHILEFHSLSERKPYLCVICSERFTSSRLLSKHKLNQHNESAVEQIVCFKCGKMISSNNIKNHLAHCTGPAAVFPCTLCDKTFKKRNYLNFHYRTHTGEKKYSCDICHAKFGYKYSVALHKASSHDGKKFPCKVCGKVYSHKSSLDEHERVHTGRQKSVACSKCGKVFTRNYYLKKHMTTHHDENTLFQCSLCQQIFLQKEQLSFHLRTHKSGKPFVCEVCGESFSHKYTAKMHMHIHTGTTEIHTCDICGKTFSRRSNLNKHKQTHEGTKPYECTQCGTRFTAKGSLKDHMEMHAGRYRFQCAYCNKRFFKKSGLKSHIQCRHKMDPANEEVMKTMMLEIEDVQIIEEENIEYIYENVDNSGF